MIQFVSGFLVVPITHCTLHAIAHVIKTLDLQSLMSILIAHATRHFFVPTLQSHVNDCSV